MRKLQRGLIFFVVSVSLALSGQKSFANHESGQMAKEDWVARYNGLGDNGDIAKDMKVDAQGNVYVTGFSYGEGTGYDCLTIKYDSNGKELWVARYDGNDNDDDYAASLAVDIQGNVYVAGRSWGDETDYDYVTIKYDPNGRELWVAHYNGQANYYDYASSLAVDQQGNVYVTGSSYSEGYSDYATIKYDPNGRELWVARYNGPSNYADNAKSLAIDSQGNVYVSGDSDAGFLQPDYATIKYDTNGNELWVARYDGPYHLWDSATSLAVDSQGNIYVTGFSYGEGTGYDCVTIKYDSNGKELWVARYNSYDNDYATSLAVDIQGNVYITGYSYRNGTSYDYATIKYDSNGKELWVARYNGLGNHADYARSVVIDFQGNVYVTGDSEGDGTDSDYSTIKYDFNGNELWVVRYNGPDNDYDKAISLAVDFQGNVYVTGVIDGNSFGFPGDYGTIRYLQLPTVSVDLEPITSIVERGGKGKYKLTLTNNSEETQIVDYWAKEKLPNGEWRINDAITPISVTLSPLEIKTQTARHNVPLQSPLGEYEYWGFVGEDIDHIWDEEMENFTVTDPRLNF